MFCDGIDEWLSGSDSEDYADAPDVWPEAIAAQMMERGETYWEHLGWHKAAFEAFGLWFERHLYEKSKMVAQWLLPSLPSIAHGGDLHQLLLGLTGDRWCEAFEGQSCQWPRHPEEYARDLNLRMAAIAEDWRSRTRKAIGQLPRGGPMPSGFEYPLPRPELF